MRWVLRMKREANRDEIDALLAATGERAVVEVSTRDPWWGARPVADRYEGHNVLGRLWMELRKQLRDGDAAARSGAWIDRIRVRVPRRRRRRCVSRAAERPIAPRHPRRVLSGTRRQADKG